MKRLVAIVMLVCSSLQAANWYVDNAAAGANSGVSWANAWQSFAAINWGSVAAGDTVYISGGTTTKTYSAPLVVTASGTSGNVITIQPGQSSPHNGTVIISATGTNGINLQNVGYITIDGSVGSTRKLFINGCTKGIYGADNGNLTYRYVTVSNATDTSFVASSCSNSVIEYCLGQSTSGGITLSGVGAAVGTKIVRHNELYLNTYDGIGGESGLSIYGNKVVKTQAETASHPDGIVVQGNRNRIYNNLILGFEQPIYLDSVMEPGTNNYVWANVTATNTAGVAYYDVVIHAEYYDVDDVKVFNNTLTVSGVRTTCNAGRTISNVHITNNIIMRQFDFEGETAGTVSNLFCNSNCFIDTPSCFYEGHGGFAYSLAAWQAFGMDTNSIVANPQFENWTGVDFRLKVASPCADRGANLGATFQQALSGTTWPNPTTTTRTGAWDIGAYESQSSGAKVTTPGKITISGKVTL